VDTKDLKKIGLTEGEICVYDALLELGETTRTMLAKRSGISPSKIYDVANRLLEKGIISVVKKDKIIHFSATNPERLKDFIDKKEAEISKERKIVESMLPSLMLKYNDVKDQSDVDVFYGWEGMKTAYMDILLTLRRGEVDYVFGASLGKDVEQADRFFSWYNKGVEKAGYARKIIFNENVRNHTQRTQLVGVTAGSEMRFLHYDTFTELNLYSNKVLIVMLLSKPIVIRIKSNEAADSFKKFFDTLWRQARK
jgi:predicted DNA-binding transcriptional regulator